MSDLIRFLRKLLRMHDHQWRTMFRGQYTRGVECAICGKADLVVDYNDGTEPVGWRGKGEG